MLLALGGIPHHFWAFSRKILYKVVLTLVQAKRLHFLSFSFDLKLFRHLFYKKLDLFNIAIDEHIPVFLHFA